MKIILILPDKVQSVSSILLRDKKVITKDDASRVFDIIDKNRTGYVNIAQVRKVYG